MNQSTLAKLSPLSQPMISNILNSKHKGKIGAEKCREFKEWYTNYRKDNPVEGIDLTPQDSRLTFHPTQEIPRLRNWYDHCNNPSDTILKQFVDELNNQPVRRERPPVTLTKLKIWWKNEKQRIKRLQSQRNSQVPQTRGRPKKNSAESSPGKNELSGPSRPVWVHSPNKLTKASGDDPMLSSTVNATPSKHLHEECRAEATELHHSPTPHSYEHNTSITLSPGIEYSHNVHRNHHRNESQQNRPLQSVPTVEPISLYALPGACYATLTTRHVRGHYEASDTERRESDSKTSIPVFPGQDLSKH